jgi:hypothetical protein
LRFLAPPEVTLCKRRRRAARGRAETWPLRRAG